MEFGWNHCPVEGGCPGLARSGFEASAPAARKRPCRRPRQLSRSVRPLWTFWGGIPMRVSLLAALTVLLLGSIPATGGEQGGGGERKVSSHVLAAVEKELDR